MLAICSRLQLPKYIQKKINPEAFNKFNDLITSMNHLVDNRSKTFVESACWADDIKGYKYNMHLWDSWHFINKPHLTDGVFPIINFTKVSINSVAVIENAKKVLSVNLNNKTAERALFARYLVHVAGDIHQPLHSVALYNKTYPEGDRGGNSLTIYYENGTKSNLHSFWDAGANILQNSTWYLERPLDNSNITNLQERANSLMNEFGEQAEKLGQNIDPAVWATESLLFSQNSTYPHVQKSNKIDENYIAKTYEICKKRILLGGYRLANIIDHIYTNSLENEEQIGLKWERMKGQAKKINSHSQSLIQES